MRSRLERMQEAYLDYIAAQEGKLLDRDETLNWERMHMASCAPAGLSHGPGAGGGPGPVRLRLRHPRHRPGGHRAPRRATPRRGWRPPGPS